MSLEVVFQSFCAFGANRDSSTAVMDNSKFAKLFRDLKLLDKKLTSTDIDIIFNRTEVKPKAERKITYDQFLEALKLVARTKYPGDSDGYQRLVSAITGGKGPVDSSRLTQTGGNVTDRLTDTSKYTGSHKQRFDESGRGRGLSGRDSAVKGHGMVAGSVASQAAYVSGYRNEGTYQNK